MFFPVQHKKRILLTWKHAEIFKGYSFESLFDFGKLLGEYSAFKLVCMVNNFCYRHFLHYIVYSDL